ncbi:hypothetical protein GGR50DRAFT_680529 [Xylaria sp. CBS 124048]|nr:hypothetical protein GGR50DRAFT_680529 [Xylaria sp. CBS 124048]
MYYIRLLRPVKIESTAAGPEVSLLLTITTDLGDSFLCPDEHGADLMIAVVDTAAVVRKRRIFGWKMGMRVLDVKFKLWPELKGEPVNCSIIIHPTDQLDQPRETSEPSGALHAREVLSFKTGMTDAYRAVTTVPARIEIVNGVCAPVSLRTLGIEKDWTDGKDGSDEKDQMLHLEFEEDIGESIARHIWDAGVVMSTYLADACSSPDSIRSILPIENKTFNVLELGSGVGILGITMASILPRAAAAQGKTLKNARVLLTDLEEAEERAKSNIAKAKATLAKANMSDTKRVSIQYENLDWNDGRNGLVGPLVAATRWDLVVLSDCTYNVDSFPALVGTLNSLHTIKQRHHATGEGVAKSSVLLATKPRHSSERDLFRLLEAHKWTYRLVKEIQLAKAEDDDELYEFVEIYLLEKGDS